MTVVAPLSTRETPGSSRFLDPLATLDGARRAHVGLTALQTLWINTGTLCNLTCENCYIESSPRNDRLAYIDVDEVAAYLDEIARDSLATREIGLTGGEPFMNPGIVDIMALCLERGFRVLVLTNAMRPMMKCADALLPLQERHGDNLTIRVSLDHFSVSRHEELRGAHSWQPTMDGISWLCGNGFRVHVAGRTCWDQPEAALRAGYGELFTRAGFPIDARNPASLVLFPEMDDSKDAPEITEQCWDILGVAPDAMMCATSRMVVKRKDAPHPVVLACTLLPYDRRFELGQTLAEASGAVSLNHPHCARFCVLGGGSCSVTS
jgi:uncharacterized Fe-S cluster-containing radical SAM superfamily protein